ncbi:MAG: hypothetical protein Q8J85_07260 [Sulfuricurvum sp.]|nr:hypothetical protein [Sulfuricurvum sp.]MDP3022975.1 hypothetical protein [Sulfuricurvum sp.]
MESKGILRTDAITDLLFAKREILGELEELQYINEKQHNWNKVLQYKKIIQVLNIEIETLLQLTY